MPTSNNSNGNGNGHQIQILIIVVGTKEAEEAIRDHLTTNNNYNIMMRAMIRMQFGQSTIEFTGMLIQTMP
eukprot:CAMPEP_0172313090 /NCGR_PEP_ID=MMETSP1058-20130122/19376_1 /TAXON_ID=83371 /ORGANISM="Detonula confervacea, Strain CCMP 353" /LENGTH=70 /DNA_ID=CAMNT_0013026687 /DNA_START=32 /DNA_END=241 /DNA_ORIENTATION=-